VDLAAPGGASHINPQAVAACRCQPIGSMHALWDQVTGKHLWQLGPSVGEK
jgi:hypothetical protein